MDHAGRAWRRWAVAAGVLLAVAAALIAIAYTGGFTDRDRAALGEAHESRTPPLNAGVAALTEIGNTAGSALLAVVAGGVLWWRGRRPEAVYVVAATATASLLFSAIKQVLQRPRPPAELRVVEASNESLPSGHATMSAVVLASIVIVCWPALAARGRTVITALAVAWSGAVGASRIYLGVHWFSDVLGGWALGLAWAAVGATALARWHARAVRVC